MTERGREFMGIFLGDVGYGAKQERETDGKDTFFAAREGAATEIESSHGGFGGGSVAQVIGDEADFFGFLGGGGDGFAEMAEREHGAASTSMA